MGIFVTDLEAFTAVGVCWKGTFKQAQAGEIRTFMQEFRERLGELPQDADKSEIIGLSYDVTSEGFTYYLCCKVPDSNGQLPEGMEQITVPALTYASYEHTAEEEVNGSYTNIYGWIESNGYRANDEINLEHVEIYPSDYHPINERPRLTIHIPINR